MIPPHDSLLVLLDDVRASRPPIWQADEWGRWLQAIAQCIAAVPTAERRWACCVLVAQDLSTAMPGMPMSVGYGVVEAAVRKASV